MERQSEVTIQTRIGRQRISMDKVVHFPRGLAGFEGRHDFILLQLNDNSPFLVLQSLEDPALGLLVADPFSFLSDYQITVGDTEQRILRLEDVRQVAVLVTVSIPPGKPEMTALNLTGPILVNHTERLGLQVPQTDPDFVPRVYLHQEDGVLRPVGGATTTSEAAT